MALTNKLKPSDNSQQIKKPNREDVSMDPEVSQSPMKTSKPSTSTDI
jgi:hypothetical protein